MKLRSIKKLIYTDEYSLTNDAIYGPGRIIDGEMAYIDYSKIKTIEPSPPARILHL